MSINRMNEQNVVCPYNGKKGARKMNLANSVQQERSQIQMVTNYVILFTQNFQNKGDSRGRRYVVVAHSLLVKEEAVIGSRHGE